MIETEHQTAGPTSLYDELGGLEMLQRVHKIFYDKTYRHPWLKQFFANVGQALIEAQQTDFMAQAMGGPSRYNGKLPPTYRQGKGSETTRRRRRT